MGSRPEVSTISPMTYKKTIDPIEKQHPNNAP